MHTPSLLERVLVRGRDALFLVIRADHEEQIADLLPFTFGGSLLGCVLSLGCAAPSLHITLIKVPPCPFPGRTWRPR
jgi:hypothetical protein